MNPLECQVSYPAEAKDGLTVGQKFHLLCKGATTPFDKKSVELRMDEVDKYKIKILDLQQNGTDLDLLVTSYVAGNNQVKNLQLVDKDNSILLGNVEFKVNSVINSNEGKVEPYGSIGPIKLHLPYWFYGTVVLAIVIIGYYCFSYFKKRTLKKRLVEKLNDFGTALSPYHQFTKAIRQIQKEYQMFSQPEQMIDHDLQFHVVQKLEQAYKIFFGRSFLIPTLDWKEKEIIKELKYYNSDIYKKSGASIEKVFDEILHAKDFSNRFAKKEMAAKDLIQLYDLIRHNVDELNLQLQQQSKERAR